MSKHLILDRPRSEVAHREISRFSRLPTPSLVTDACMSVLGSSIVTFSHLYTPTHTQRATATHTHSCSHTHTHAHSVTHTRSSRSLNTLENSKTNLSKNIFH